MKPHVLLQNASITKVVPMNIKAKRLFSCMNPHVLLQTSCFYNIFTTMRTAKSYFSLYESSCVPAFYFFA